MRKIKRKMSVILKGKDFVNRICCDCNKHILGNNPFRCIMGSNGKFYYVCSNCDNL